MEEQAGRRTGRSLNLTAQICASGNEKKIGHPFGFGFALRLADLSADLATISVNNPQEVW
jgi:hypothetical protein